MKRRRILSLLLILLLAASLPLTALAEDHIYDIANGDITISAKLVDGKVVQTVTQDGSTYTDDAPVITGSTQRFSVFVDTEEGATAKFTIQDLSIQLRYVDLIDVGNSSAEITVSGTNSLILDRGCAINVTGGSLTLKGYGSLYAENNLSEDCAVIGTRSGVAMSGSIHITEGVKLMTQEDANDTHGGRGAGIGTGYQGELSGSILIDGNAVVNAYSAEDGAAIGSGKSGDLTGSITISGNAKVDACGGADGASIGSGAGNYSDNTYTKMSGTITIGGSARVDVRNYRDGAAIGSGYRSELSGEINIGDNASIEAYSGVSGAVIGTGFLSRLTGTININGNANVSATAGKNGAGIGAGMGSLDSETYQYEYTDVAGTINIGGNAVVVATSKDDGAGIGAGEFGMVTGTININGNADVTATSGDGGSGIGSGGCAPMAGTINISGSAKVNATSQNNDLRYGGAGIGSGFMAQLIGTVNIDGNANVTAVSEALGAGIGTGYNANVTESGKIVIAGHANVNATGKQTGAGIGTGEYGKMAGTVSVGGYATVNAAGETDGAGIGSGRGGKMAGTISVGDYATVSASGVNGAGIGAGQGTRIYPSSLAGTIELGGKAAVTATSENGAAIGEGAAYSSIFDSASVKAQEGVQLRIRGEKESSIDKNDLTEGFVAEFAKGKNPATDIPDSVTYKDDDDNLVTCTENITIIERVDPTATESGHSSGYNCNGREVVVTLPPTGVVCVERGYETELVGDVLTITVKSDDAILTGDIKGMKALGMEGVRTVVFVTNKATSTFDIADLLEKGAPTDIYKLNHKGEKVTFVNATDYADIMDILK